MSPIKIVLLCIAIGIALLVIAMCWIGYRERKAHERTKDIPPAVDQVWVENGERLFIQSVSWEGIVSVLNEDSDVWVGTLESWRERVNVNKLFLFAEKGKDNGDLDHVF